VQPAAPTGRLVGRYALYDKIASGGMATVYFGRLLGPSGFARTVAVKCLYPQFARDPDFSAMFLDEARLASRIRSPYVVPTLDVVSEGGELVIVMEYIQGESLGTLVQSLSDTDANRGYPAAPDIPVAVAVSVLGDVLEGLHAAHEARSEQGEPLGIVHRDVSPQNIIVGTDGLGHLIDFGVAKATGRLQTTREGQLKGKLAYMAPEQLRGEPVTRRSDVFAASVVLWEMLVGERLFCAGDEGATVTRVLMGDVKPPSKAVRRNRDPIAVQAIEGLDAVVMRGLERDPTQRFESAREMAVALEGCLAPASAAEVTRWLEEVAGPPLARRAAAIAALEGSVAGGPTSSPRQDGDADAPAQPIADASSISVVSGITTVPSAPRRRAGLWLAAGVMLSMAIAVARIPWRGPAPARSTAAPELAAASSSEPEPADSSPAASSTAVASNAPPPGAPASPSVASPPRRAPAAPRASDCTPPFTWDAQGKKHYKRQCL
jgi:serine/threonine protein kinase